MKWFVRNICHDNTLKYFQDKNIKFWFTLLFKIMTGSSTSTSFYQNMEITLNSNNALNKVPY